VINAKRKLLFLLINIFIISVAIVFLIRPSVESLQIARTNVRLMERRYAAWHRMALDYEYNLSEIESPGQGMPVYYEEFPLVLAEVSRLAVLNNLHQVNFVASEPVGYDMEFFDHIFEMRVRVNYQGTVDDISRFLYDLNGEPVSVFVANVTFGYDGLARLNLEFSIFAR